MVRKSGYSVQERLRLKLMLHAAEAGAILGRVQDARLKLSSTMLKLVALAVVHINETISEQWPCEHCDESLDKGMGFLRSG